MAPGLPCPPQPSLLANACPPRNPGSGVCPSLAPSCRLAWGTSPTLPPGRPQTKSARGPANAGQAPGPYHGELSCCPTPLLDLNCRQRRHAPNCRPLHCAHGGGLARRCLGPYWSSAPRGGPRPGIPLPIGYCLTHGVWPLLIGCVFGGKATASTKAERSGAFLALRLEWPRFSLRGAQDIFMRVSRQRANGFKSRLCRLLAWSLRPTHLPGPDSGLCKHDHLAEVCPSSTCNQSKGELLHPMPSKPVKDWSRTFPVKVDYWCGAAQGNGKPMLKVLNF